MGAGYDISASQSSSAATGAIKFGPVFITGGVGGSSGGGIMTLVLIGAAVWFFFLRKKK